MLQFFANRADSHAVIVMCRIDPGILRQNQQFIEQAVILSAGISVLEIGTAGAPDQQSITGKHTVREHETVRIISVPWSVESIHVEVVYA